jgi:hypothetical protein
VRDPFDNSSTKSNDLLKELADSLVEYDSVDLISAVAGLQLFPQNASRVTRLEAFAHSVGSLPPSSGPKISAGRLRRVCAHPALESLAYAEDPAENLFVEEFSFFDGPYLVLPGIAQAGEFILSNLCKAIFLNSASWPAGFKAEAFQLVASTLTVSNVVLQKAGLRRGVPPASNRYEDIVVPDAGTFSKLKHAVCFQKAELGSLFEAQNLAASALDRILCKPQPGILADYDVVNGPLLWRPFLDCADRIVVAIPGMIVSAVRQGLLALAREWNVQDKLAKAYTEAVWRNVNRSFSFTKNIPLRHPVSEPLTIPNAMDGFFSLDRDKVVYCLLVTDPLRRDFEHDPFGFWTDDLLQQQIDSRIANIEKEVFSSVPTPNDLFIVATFQGLGGGAAFGFNLSAAACESIALSAEDLHTISALERGDPLALFNFARSRNKVRQHVELTTTNVLDEFCLYRSNEHSFYFSDKEKPDVIVIPPGECLSLNLEIGRRRDFHAAQTPEGGLLDVVSLHNNADIPISAPLTDLGKRARLVVEGLGVPLWVTAPEEIDDAEEYRYYALVVDALSFWIWQFSWFLAPLLSRLQINRAIEIRLTLPPKDIWQSSSSTQPDKGKTLVDTKTDAERLVIEIRVNAGLIPLLMTVDNQGERELMHSVLLAFSSLAESRNQSPSKPDLAAALERTIPLGLKKMLLLFDAGRNPELDNRGLPDYRPVQKVWISEQLDRVGQFLCDDKTVQIGEIASAQRTAILNKVAAFCFSQMEKRIATLSRKDLLPFFVAQLECVYREQALNKLTIPTRRECSTVSAGKPRQQIFD